MSDATPDWMAPATDLLRERIHDEAADALARLPAAEDRLERAVETIEDWLRNGPIRAWSVADPLVKVVAEHRRETPEATLARLFPPVADALSPAVEWIRFSPGTALITGEDGMFRPYRSGEPVRHPVAFYDGAYGVMGMPAPAPPPAMPGVAHRPDWHDMTSLPGDAHEARMRRLIREGRIGPR